MLDTVPVAVRNVTTVLKRASRLTGPDQIAKETCGLAAGPSLTATADMNLTGFRLCQSLRLCHGCLAAIPSLRVPNLPLK